MQVHSLEMPQPSGKRPPILHRKNRKGRTSASFERCLGDSNSAAVEGIDAHLLELQQELLKLANAKQNYDAIADEIDELREEKEELLLQEANKDGIRQRMADMVSFLQSEQDD